MLLQVAPDGGGAARPSGFAQRLSRIFRSCWTLLLACLFAPFVLLLSTCSCCSRARLGSPAPMAPASPRGTCACCSRAPRGSPAPQPPASPSAASSHDSLQ